MKVIYNTQTRECVHTHTLILFLLHIIYIVLIIYLHTRLICYLYFVVEKKNPFLRGTIDQFILNNNN